MSLGFDLLATRSGTYKLTFDSALYNNMADFIGLDIIDSSVCNVF